MGYQQEGYILVGDELADLGETLVLEILVSD